MENRKAIQFLVVLVLLAATNLITWNIAKNENPNKLVASGSGAPPSPASLPGGMRVISGSAENISESGFTLNVPSYDPSSSGGASRTVIVDNDTVIESMVQKDSATLQREQAAFMEKIKDVQNVNTASPDAGAPIVPPEPFIREKMTLKDIKEGDLVTVTSNEDVSKAKKFTAVRISVQPRMAPPASTVAPSPASQN